MLMQTESALPSLHLVNVGHKFEMHASFILKILNVPGVHLRVINVQVEGTERGAWRAPYYPSGLEAPDESQGFGSVGG